MDLNLSGKTAAVVGGATGIGKAVCLTLAAEGCNIGVLDKNIEAAEATVKEIQGKAVAAQVNIADFDSVSAAFAKVAAECVKYVFCSEDKEEGGKAFREKRDPVWKGR